MCSLCVTFMQQIIIDNVIHHNIILLQVLTIVWISFQLATCIECQHTYDMYYVFWIVSHLCEVICCECDHTHVLSMHDKWLCTMCWGTIWTMTHWCETTCCGYQRTYVLVYATSDTYSFMDACWVVILSCIDDVARVFIHMWWCTYIEWWYTNTLMNVTNGGTLMCCNMLRVRTHQCVDECLEW